MKILSLLRVASAAFFFVGTSAFAQTPPLLSQGQVLGNFGTGTIPAKPTTILTFPVVSGNLACFSGTTGLLQDCGKSPSASADVRNFAVSPLIPTTVCTGSDDTATFQAAATAAATLAGNTVVVPALPCKSTATGVSLLNAVNVKIVGQGAGTGATFGGVSGFNTTAASGSLIATPGASGLDIGNMRMSYSNASYSGNLIDLSQGAGNANSSFITLHDFAIGGQGSAVGAAALINTNLTLATTIRNGFLANAAYGIKMGASSNAIHMEELWFNEGFSNSQILVQGEALLENSSVHEPATGSLVASAMAATGTTDGLVLLSNAYNDATSGHYLDFTGGNVNGFAAIGNNFAGGTFTGDLGSMWGGLIAGNELDVGGVSDCIFNGASARSIVAFGNHFDTQGGPGFGLTWCDSGPKLGNNFYETGSTANGFGTGFVLTQFLNINNYGMTSNTSSDGLLLKNPTAATANNQEFSPRLHLQGQGWKTTATAASQAVDFIAEVQPVQGTAAPTGKLVISSAINGGSFAQNFALDSGGQFTLTSLNAVSATAIPVFAGGGGANGMFMGSLCINTSYGSCAPPSGGLTVSGTAALNAVTVGGNTMTFPAAAATLTQTVASGTAGLATTAIASGACAVAVPVAATNVVSTDVVIASFNGDPTSVTGYIPSTAGMLTIIAYPTANLANFKVCNNSSSSITPGAITLNWRVVR